MTSVDPCLDTHTHTEHSYSSSRPPFRGPRKLWLRVLTGSSCWKYQENQYTHTHSPAQSESVTGGGIKSVCDQRVFKLTAVYETLQSSELIFRTKEPQHVTQTHTRRVRHLCRHTQTRSCCLVVASVRFLLMSENRGRRIS